MHVKFALLIDSGDAAFQDGYHREELLNLLENVAQRIRNGKEIKASFTVMDNNGNGVGKCTFHFDQES